MKKQSGSFLDGPILASISGVITAILIGTTLASRPLDIGFSDRQDIYIGVARGKDKDGGETSLYSTCSTATGSAICVPINDCIYSNALLLEQIPSSLNRQFIKDAATLLMGSLPSSLTSCEFQAEMFLWLLRTRPECNELRGFDHCPSMHHLEK